MHDIEILVLQMMHSKLLLPFKIKVAAAPFYDAVAVSLAVEVALACNFSCSGCCCFPLFSFSFFSFIHVVACSF
jgi:hypothetical protein